MNSINKIIKLIKNDTDIANDLFLLSDFPDDVSLWIDPSRNGIDYSNITWL